MPTVNQKTVAVLVSGGAASRPLKSLLTAILAANFTLYTAGVSADNVPSCAGTENTAITATTAHLTDNSDGTISDAGAGLVWKRCSEGQSWDMGSNGCTGTAADFNWQAGCRS